MSKSKGSTYLCCMTEQNSRGLLCRSKLSRALSNSNPLPPNRIFFIKTENLCVYLILKYCFKVIECRLLRPIKPIVKWSWPLHQLRLPSLGYHPSWSVKNWCNFGRVMSQKNFVHTYLLTFNSTHIFIVVFISAHEIECYHKKTIEVWSNRAY